MIPYITPFAIYIALSLLGSYFDSGAYWLYPVKTLAVAAALWYFRESYPELRTRLRPVALLTAVATGLLVFVVWIAPEGLYPHLGESRFNPFIFQNSYISVTLVVFRLIGAVLVVPVFEELFWRSFLLRWVSNPDFKKVELGKFTWLSFAVVTLFFGFEHNRWLVGLAAGAVYNLLLYRHKNLWSCIAAHAVTNLVLGVYVLQTQQWGFW